MILNEALRFEFVSVGIRIISKVIVYEETDLPHLYNLGMGDVTSTGRIDFETVSNNSDRDQILATVLQTLFIFFDKYPDSFVAFTGSTPQRTRLYQIVIARDLEKATSLFNFWGLNENGQIQRFAKNNSYIGFIISLKSNSAQL